MKLSEGKHTHACQDEIEATSGCRQVKAVASETSPGMGVVDKCSAVSRSREVSERDERGRELPAFQLW